MLGNELLSLLTPKLEPLAAWLIYTCSRTILRLFDDCPHLRRALAEVLASDGPHLHGMCRVRNFHPTGIGVRVRAAAHRAVELRWIEGRNVLRCYGEFSRKRTHRVKNSVHPARLPSYDWLELLDDHVLLGLCDRFELFQAFDLDSGLTDDRERGVSCLGDWMDDRRAQPPWGDTYYVGSFHGGAGLVAYMLEPRGTGLAQVLVLRESYESPIAERLEPPDGPPSRRTRAGRARAEERFERTLLRVTPDEAASHGLPHDLERCFTAVQLSQHSVVAVSQHHHGLFVDGEEKENFKKVPERVLLHVWPLAALRAMPRGQEELQAPAMTVEVRATSRAMTQSIFVQHMRCAGQFVVLLVESGNGDGRMTELQVWSAAAGVAPHLCFSMERGVSHLGPDTDDEGGEAAPPESRPPGEAEDPSSSQPTIQQLEACCLLSPACLAVHAEAAPVANGQPEGALRTRMRIAVGTDTGSVGVWQIDLDPATLTADEQSLCFWSFLCVDGKDDDDDDDEDERRVAGIDDRRPVVGIGVDSATVIWARGVKISCTELLVHPRCTPLNYMMPYVRRWVLPTHGRVTRLVAGRYFVAAVVRREDEEMYNAEDQVLVLSVARTDCHHRLPITVVGSADSDDEDASDDSDDDDEDDDDDDDDDDDGDEDDQ